MKWNIHIKRIPFEKLKMIALRENMPRCMANMLEDDIPTSPFAYKE